MPLLRKGSERGQTDLGWLRSLHTFSFEQYHDPQQMGFRQLRVLNEEHLLPGVGYPTHSHRDIIIITYLLEGTIEHRDSLGNQCTLEAGDVQLLVAGSGITHSERNTGKNQAHFFQIWLTPAQTNDQPRYQRLQAASSERNLCRLLGCVDGRDGSLLIGDDVSLFFVDITPETSLRLPFAPGRAGWIQMIEGEFSIGDVLLRQGDGVAIHCDSEVMASTSSQRARCILFDLP
jgi:redox-sensitive bicupin YhaK (pirin superfamily)